MLYDRGVIKDLSTRPELKKGGETNSCPFGKQGRSAGIKGKIKGFGSPVPGPTWGGWGIGANHQKLKQADLVKHGVKVHSGNTLLSAIGRGGGEEGRRGGEKGQTDCKKTRVNQGKRQRKK